MEYQRNTSYRLCKTNTRVYREHLAIVAQPDVKLSLVRSSERDKPAMLMCSAYNFSPKLIRVTWYRDGRRATSDVSATEELADGDWYYQIHSHLEFTPKAGEKISCVVEHASLKEPLEVVWESSMASSERTKVAIGAAGLMLGLLVCSAGLLYYRKKTQG
ncbi:H-2 class II histocompatibility antigen, A-S beta chain-like [Engraulis encrasicolus]|uniref:H-2 class II histocompatibility antigen, A-S beta chain-like n=1 Tax=Engraulis encrasicolus TaxID=184585 RepID=UPI002FD28DE9